MDKPKILIVDDEAIIRDVLNRFLAQKIECDIREVGDGRSALESLKSDTFDLIILDIKMPGISGTDVLKKTRLTHPQTDILVLSAWDSQSIASDALKDGAVDYIPKPSSIKVIYEKVCGVLKKKNKYFPKDTEKKII